MSLCVFFNLLHVGLVVVLLTVSRYYHYVNTVQNADYLDELKLMGWDYIDYIQGWPVLSYT